MGESKSDEKARTSLPPLAAFDRRHRLLLAILALVFVAAVALRLNGWSLPIWHASIDGSPPREVLVGHPRPERSDDFLLDLGATLAQEKARPAFPLHNPDFGSGEYMAAPLNLPAGVFITLFRPFTWGFLIGADTGLAWKWWGLTLGLFYGVFLVLLVVSRNRFWLSAAGGAAVVFSPYFQFWSLHKAEITIHACCTFIALTVVLAASRRGWIWAAGLFGGWSAAAMLLDHIYPAIAVPLGWLLLSAVAAWIWDAGSRLSWRRHGKDRAGALLAGTVIFAGSLAGFWLQGGPEIAAIRDTVYPGHRLAAGGYMPWWAFFSHSFFAQAWEHGHPWYGNVCEQSSFFFLFPLTLLLAAAASVRRRRVEPWTVLLALYLAGVLAYTYLGFPLWLAELTGMGRSNSNRTQLALGLADVILLVAACSRLGVRERISAGMRWSALALWLIALAFAGHAFQREWPLLPTWAIAAGLAVQLALGWMLWIRGWAAGGVAALAAVSFAYTAWFNPVVHGGSDFVLHNPLSNAIRATARADHNEHAWAVFGDLTLCDLPQIIGAHGYGGYNAVPDFETWRHFDPAGAARDVYNQSAYAVFTAGSGGRAQFVPMAPGYFILEVDPTHPAFAQLGVRYFIACDAPTAETFRRTGQFRERFSYAGKTIFEAK